MKCEIIKDLLPGYADGLTSVESNDEIEAHLEICPECNEILERMKAEISDENQALNIEDIKPFRKLNRRILRAVLITLAACVLLTGAYFYFFEIGWKTESGDVKIQYSYRDGDICIDFELTDGKVLNPWLNHHEFPQSITFTECFSSLLDDRGEYPNQYSYSFNAMEDGKLRAFTDDDCLVLHFKDKTEVLYYKQIAEELGVQ